MSRCPGIFGVMINILSFLVVKGCPLEALVPGAARTISQMHWVCLLALLQYCGVVATLKVHKRMFLQTLMGLLTTVHLSVSVFDCESNFVSTFWDKAPILPCGDWRPLD